MLKGWGLVLDVSWVDHRHRAGARWVADQAAADLVELQVDAPPAVAAERIAARRAAGGDASDATVDVAVHLRRRFDPWPEAVVVDTTRPLGECVRQALAQL